MVAERRALVVLRMELVRDVNLEALLQLLQHKRTTVSTHPQGSDRISTVKADWRAVDTQRELIVPK